jgi:hypothetical protein
MRSWLQAAVFALSLCILGLCATEARSQNHYFWGWPPGYYPGYSGYGSGTYYSPGYSSYRTYNFGVTRIYPIHERYESSYEPYYGPSPYSASYPYATSRYSNPQVLWYR